MVIKKIDEIFSLKSINGIKELEDLNLEDLSLNDYKKFIHEQINLLFTDDGAHITRAYLLSKLISLFSNSNDLELENINYKILINILEKAKDLKESWYFYYIQISNILIDGLINFISVEKLNEYNQETKISVLKHLYSSQLNFSLIKHFKNKGLIISDVEGLNPYYYVLNNSNSTHFIIESLLNLNVPLPKNYWSYLFKEISYNRINANTDYLLNFKDKNFIIDGDTEESVWDLIIKNKSYNLIKFIPEEFYKATKNNGLLNKLMDVNNFEIIKILKKETVKLLKNEDDFLKLISKLLETESNYEVFLEITPNFLAIAKSENSTYKDNENLKLVLSNLNAYKIFINNNNVNNPINALKNVYVYMFSNKEIECTEKDFIKEYLLSLDNIIKLFKTRRDFPNEIREQLQSYLKSLPGFQESAPKQNDNCYDYYKEFVNNFNFIEHFNDENLYIDIDLLIKLINRLDKNIFENLCKKINDKIPNFNTKIEDIEVFKNEDVEKEKNLISLELFSQEVFAKFKKEHGTSNNDVLKDFIRKNANISVYNKTLALASTFLENIAQLYETFPHFKEVIEHIENLMILQNKGDKSFYIPPLLLGGGPGVGKTFFCHTISKLVNTHFELLNMESMTANFILTGLSSQFSNATPGKIFNSLFNEDYKTMNPIFLLDELEKSSGDSRYSVMNSLLPLLERYTAKNFKDECIPLPIDASYIVWIATANDIDKLTAPIRSRFDIFSIPNPTPMQRKSLIKGIYKTVRSNNSWGSFFDETLPEETLNKLANLMSPGAARDLRKSITMACSKAIREDKNILLPSHIEQYDEGEIMPWNIVL